MTPRVHPRIGIEFISVFGLPPVEFVRLAADLGVGHVGMALEPIIPFNPHGYPEWSLRRDAALRRDLVSALGDTEVHVSVGEGFFIRPGGDIDDYAGDLDIVAGLGIKRVNVLSFEPDATRSMEQCARFVAMARERGLKSVIEFMPGYVVDTLAAAAETVRQIGGRDFSILVDSMHFFRSGSSPAELGDIDPGLIGYLQLCDVPRVCECESYSYEARFERRSPGEGELPLAEFLAAAPRNLVVGLELPQRSRAEAGIDPHSRLAPAVAATSAMLQALDC